MVAGSNPAAPTNLLFDLTPKAGLRNRNETCSVRVHLPSLGRDELLRTQDGLRAFVLTAIVASCTGPAAQDASPIATATSSPSSSTVPTALPSPSSLATPESTLTAAPTDPPEETPSAGGPGWAKDPPKPLLLYTAVRVVVDNLNLRSEPSTTARRLGTIASNSVLVVTTFPSVDAEGYIWYYGIGPASKSGELRPLPEDPYAGIGQLGGWFAAMKGTTPYVEPLGPRCPASIDLKNVGAMLPAERLACFGGDTIEFEGTYGCPGCTPEFFGAFRPRWLADPNIVNFVSEVGTNRQGLGMILRFPPAISERPADGSIIRVRGHFDDPKSVDCSVAIDPPWGDIIPVPAPTSFARAWCRRMFVVDEYEFLGTDPAFKT